MAKDKFTMPFISQRKNGLPIDAHVCVIIADPTNDARCISFAARMSDEMFTHSELKFAVWEKARSACKAIDQYMNENQQNLEEIVLVEDTVVKFQGIPFLLKAGSALYGKRDNYALAVSERDNRQPAEKH